jgi:pimeloyl-ACP methyl ester carboxylesterase
MQIVVDDLLTNYQLSGSGKLVLLLHGWADSSKGLANLQTQLSKHYQVLAVDLPGFGASQIPKDSWNLDNYARFLGALLQKLALPQPYAVVGHSNGGAIAIRALSLKTIQPQKLVLLAASGVRNQQGLRKRALSAVAKTGNLATIWLPKRYRQRLRSRLYQAAGSDMLVVPELEDTFKQTVAQDVQADAATITIPTLLVYASADQAAPVSYGKRYHQLMPQSRLEIIEGAGHFVHLDEPEKVQKLIEEFLA